MDHYGLPRPTKAHVEGPLLSSDGEWYWRRVEERRGDKGVKEAARAVAEEGEHQHLRLAALQGAADEAIAEGMRLFVPAACCEHDQEAEHWIEYDLGMGDE